MEKADKSLVQVDDSTMWQDATSISCMSLYKLLVTLEKVKKNTDHKLSLVEVKRKEESEERFTSPSAPPRSSKC